jgi:hypothetical protein
MPALMWLLATGFSSNPTMSTPRVCTTRKGAATVQFHGHRRGGSMQHVKIEELVVSHIGQHISVRYDNG